eukprot:370162-Prymnesium_polylepis.1
MLVRAVRPKPAAEAAGAPSSKLLMVRRRSSRAAPDDQSPLLLLHCSEGAVRASLCAPSDSLAAGVRYLTLQPEHAQPPHAALDGGVGCAPESE